MANESRAEDNFNTIVVGAIATTLVLLLILPMIFVASSSPGRQPTTPLTR